MLSVPNGRLGPPRASSFLPGLFDGLIEVNENRVGPPNTLRESDKILDSDEDLEYIPRLPFSMVNDDVTRTREISVANTLGWARIVLIVRSALVCGVLALALASIMCLIAGLPVIPGWLQGVSAISGVVVGATIGMVRGPAA
jgi:hypothetical protein